MFVRSAVLSMASLMAVAANGDEANVKLVGWEKGLGVTSVSQPEMTVFLWFYEWNMFEARAPGIHTSGRYDFPREIGPDGQRAVIRAPGMTLRAEAVRDGAVLSLEIQNTTDHDWPAIAGIIPCFNPGAPQGQAARFPLARLNPQFNNRRTWFLGKDGLARQDQREIHFNHQLREQVNAVATDGKFPFTFKWPTSAENAHAGLMLRESSDGKWVAAIAWERFLSAQGHNPWACMHLCVNVGPLKVGESRTIRGRIYLFPGDKQQCLQRYRGDFEN